MFYTDTALVLKRLPYAEFDLLITFMSANHGRFTTLAKGVRRINSRRGGHLDLFNHVEASFHRGRGSLDIVTEVKTLDSFEKLRHSLGRVQQAFYFCELIDVLLPEGEKNYSAYRLVVDWMNRLEHGLEGKADLASRDFSIALLRDLGYWSDQVYTNPNIDPRVVVENIIERRLHTPWVSSSRAGLAN